MVKINKYREIHKSGPRFLKALFNKNTPLAPKLMVLAAISYAIIPTDLINDFIPILGFADEIVILPLLIYMANRALEKYEYDTDDVIIEGEIVE